MATPLRSGRQLWAAIWAVALLLAGPCSTAQSSRPEVTTPVDLGLLDSPIREQYLRVRRQLDATLESRSASDRARAEAFGELGRWFHVYDYLERARLCYEAGQSLLTEDFRWPYYLGHVLRDLGQLAVARSSFRRALDLNPSDVPTLVWLGTLYFEEGNLDAAEQLLKRAVELDPGAVRGLGELGRLELARGRPEAAARHLEAALELQPEAPSLHYSLGMAYRGQGDRERARHHLERARVGQSTKVPARLEDPLLAAVKAMKRGSKPLAGRAGMLFSQGHFSEAADAFHRAQEANPDNPSLGANRGLALIRAGKLEEALVVLTRVTERFGEYAAGHYNLGVALLESGDVGAAVSQFLYAIEIDPGFIEAHDALASGRLIQNRPQEALAQYERIQDLDPANERARYRHAALLMQLGRYAEAREALDEAQGVVASRSRLSLLLARLLAAAPATDLQDGEAALALTQRAIAEPPSLFAIETMAMAYARLALFDDAVAWQRRALGATGLGEPREAIARIRRRLRSYQDERPSTEPLHPSESP